MTRYSIEPEREIMLKDMDFCHLLETYLTNIKINYWIQD